MLCTNVPLARPELYRIEADFEAKVEEEFNKMIERITDGN